MAETVAPWPRGPARADHGLAVADIGGTNSRFALARRTADGIELACGWRTPTAAHATLQHAWTAWREAMAARGVEAAPHAACIAVAAPVAVMAGGPVQLTNARWLIERESLAPALDVENIHLVNDFEAAAHSVPYLGTAGMLPVRGEAALAGARVLAVVGPGTGLGVAALMLQPGHAPRVLASEGGHAGYAPADEADDRLLAFARRALGRVSVERIVSGPGLQLVHDWLADEQGAAPWSGTQAELWRAAREEAGGGRPGCALEHWLGALGRAAGDHVLTLGAGALVLAGGLAPRLVPWLAGGAFAAGLADKGRFGPQMERLGVFAMRHAEPGLLGAAAAWWARA